MRSPQYISRRNGQHWVGDGFYVSTLLSHADRRRDPFLLFDYAAPQDFPAAADTPPRGVGAHPHKGFETVTLAFQGEVAHRDSGGNGGIIGAGDVQWMTAGRGIVHQEFHSEAFTRRGGTFEMAQLWVNLPARDKNVRPRYQHLRAADIPVLSLPQDSGSLRVVAGAYGGTRGAAATFTELNIWDIYLNANARAELALPANHTATLAVLHGGAVGFGGGEAAETHSAAFFEAADGGIVLETGAEVAHVLLLSGVPIGEPVAAYGPFVMNTQDEIRQALEDFRAGRFGGIE